MSSNSMTNGKMPTGLIFQPKKKLTRANGELKNIQRNRESEKQTEGTRTMIHNNTRLASSDEERERMAQRAEANRKLFRKQPNFRREKCDGAEPRSRRVQLLVKPSIFEKLQSIATETNVSINQIAERAFLSYIENHKQGDDR